MQVLFVLAIPGLVFGFLLQVPELRFERLDFYALWGEEDSWIDVLPALVVIIPALLAARALYIVVDWLTSGPRPGPRAKP
jgi:hypothetical protein